MIRLLRETFSQKKWEGISQVKLRELAMDIYPRRRGKKITFEETIRKKGVSQFEEQQRENGRICGN